MPNKKLFNQVGGIRPRKSVFDLSYTKKFTCDMGQLIPVMCDEVVPGDYITLGNEQVIRFQPLIAPVMHNVTSYVHYFFVPYRILWDKWVDFITGGVKGDFSEPIPTWNPTENNIGSLWDFLGFPIGVKPAGRFPVDFPRRAYNLIYNEFYRDENLQDLVPLDNEKILNRSWFKDYFTSALPWQQRGDAPGLPIAGISNAVFPPNAAVQVDLRSRIDPVTGGYVDLGLYSDGTTNPKWNAIGATSAGVSAKIAANISNTELFDYLNSNQINFSNLATFDVNDIRRVFQIQKWMERNARGGVRYTEFLRSHFGVAPHDARLQRPEYIGGSKSPVIVSEVLQTSQSTSDSPQANMSGHAVSADRSFSGKYRVQEYGLIMGIMSVMPSADYIQGINRQWLRETKYDFYFPEFSHLSEQAIEQVEIYATDADTANKKIFGYQGRYDEMRTKQNMVCSEMRTVFEYWHLARKFSNAPALNEEFIRCVPSKRIFAVQNVPGLLVNFGNLIKAVRPIPSLAEPGLIDHN